MANITIHTWPSAPDREDGGLSYPASSITKLVSPGSVIIPPSIRFVVITCDINTRVTFDGSAVTAGDMPLMSAVPNEFSISAPPLGMVLTFL